MTDDLYAAWQDASQLAQEATVRALKAPPGAAQILQMKQAVRLQREALALLAHWLEAKKERDAELVALHHALTHAAAVGGRPLRSAC